jgi:hypothetical protein
MKNSTVLIGIPLIFTLLISCSTRRKVGNHQILIENPIDQSIAIPDSTLEPGYNPKQRALAYFLMSLPKEEQEKWKSNGSFSEQEKDNFLIKIDSLQMDIQLPDPPNSITPDTLKK